MRVRVRAAALAVALVVAACSATSHKQAAAHRGGVLRVALPPITSLDPAQAVTSQERLLASALFTPLAEYDPTTLAAVPGLASWQASPDLRTWTFTLRPGARFSDGTAVTGEDVAFTLNRIARKGAGSGVADLLAPVVGFSAMANGAAAALSGVTVPEGGVVRIALDRPWADLPSALANPAFGVVPRQYGPTPAPADPTVTSGPFALTSRSSSGLVLRAVPGGGALLDGISVTTFADPSSAYDAFVGHAVDWALVPPASADVAAQRYGQGGYGPLAAALFYGFNLRDHVFADLRFRQAIVQAVDRAAVGASAYRSTVSPFTGVVVAGIVGHQADPCGSPCAYDPAASRALLAEAFPGGHPPTIAIDFDQDPTQQQVASQIQSDLAAVGVTSTLRPHLLAEYQKFVLAGRAQIFRLGWVASYPSADAFLTPLFSSGAATNLTGLSDSAVDSELAAARAEADPTARVSRYEQAERLVMAQLPVIPIAQFQTHAVIAPSVHGLTMNALGIFNPATVWVG